MVQHESSSKQPIYNTATNSAAKGPKTHAMHFPCKGCGTINTIALVPFNPQANTTPNQRQPSEKNIYDQSATRFAHPHAPNFEANKVLGDKTNLSNNSNKKVKIDIPEAADRKARRGRPPMYRFIESNGVTIVTKIQKQPENPRPIYQSTETTKVRILYPTGIHPGIQPVPIRPPYAIKSLSYGNCQMKFGQNEDDDFYDDEESDFESDDASDESSSSVAKMVKNAQSVVPLTELSPISKKLKLNEESNDDYYSDKESIAAPEIRKKGDESQKDESSHEQTADYLDWERQNHNFRNLFCDPNNQIGTKRSTALPMSAKKRPSAKIVQVN